MAIALYSEVLGLDIGRDIAIVAYLLKARTVKAEKQPLLDNGPYTRSRGTRYLRCDVTQQ
jgi:hypothetical protein